MVVVTGGGAFGSLLLTMTEKGRLFSSFVLLLQKWGFVLMFDPRDAEIASKRVSEGKCYCSIWSKCQLILSEWTPDSDHVK